MLALPLKKTPSDVIVPLLAKIYMTSRIKPDLVARGYNAGEIVKQVARVTSGNGGGKARLAQAGGKYKNKVDEALRSVKSLI